jgi:polyphosphate kinase
MPKVGMPPKRKVCERKVQLPKRSDKGRYNDQASLRGLKHVMARY